MPTPRVSGAGGGGKARDHKFLVVLLLSLTLPKVMPIVLSGPLQADVPHMATEIEF